MLDAEQEGVASAGQVEIGVTPRPEVAASAEPLTGKVGSVLAGMVDEEDGGVEGAGELSESGEDGGDLASVVFVGTLKTDVGIEDQECGTVFCEGETESLEIM